MYYLFNNDKWNDKNNLIIKDRKTQNKRKQNKRKQNKTKENKNKKRLLCFDPCSLAYDASYQVSTFSEPNGSTA
jgi:hypothetical protein